MIRKCDYFPSGWCVTIIEVDMLLNAFPMGDAEIKPYSKHLAVSRFDERLYVSGNGELTVFDPQAESFSYSFVASTTMEGGDIALSADDTKLYVIEEENDRLKIIDTDTLTQTGTVSVGDRPISLRTSKTANKTYVVNSNDASITVIDNDTDTATATIALPTGTEVLNVAFSADGSQAYALHGKFSTTGDTRVSVIDVASDTLVDTIDFPRSWYSADLAVVDNGYTATGDDVSASPAFGMNVTLGNVATSGLTTATVIETPPVLPYNFYLVDVNLYFDLQTTADWSGTARICTRYATGDLFDGAVAKFMHYENGVWVDRTVENNVEQGWICAEVDSFSPFAVMQQVSGDVQEVEIDVRPNASENIVNKLSHGTVPVAILSSSQFDAIDVDLSTVQFADSPVAIKNSGKFNFVEKDVNKDGLMDVVARFEIETMTLTIMDFHGTVVGSLKNGQLFTGQDSVRVVRDAKDEDAE